MQSVSCDAGTGANIIKWPKELYHTLIQEASCDKQMVPWMMQLSSYYSSAAASVSHYWKVMFHLFDYFNIINTLVSLATPLVFQRYV